MGETEARALEGVEIKAAGAELMQPTLADGLTLDEALRLLGRLKRLLLRNWLWLVAPVIVGGAVGVALAALLPPKVAASFEVRLVPKTAENPVARYERSNVEYFQSAEHNFGSLTLVEATLAELGEPEASFERVAEVQGSLHFYPIGHLTYRGQYTAATPESSLQFLERHLERYLETDIAKTLRVIQAEVDFLESQRVSVAEELRQSEAALRGFKEANADGLPEQAKEHMQLLRSLETRQREVSAELARLQLELELNQSKLKGEKLFVESKVISTQRAQPYQSAIVEINKQIAIAEANRMRGEHPEMQRLLRLRAKLEALSEASKGDASTAIERSRNPIFESIQDSVYQLEVQVAVADKELKAVEAQLVRARQIVTQLPALEARFADLMRSYETNSELHDQILRQLKVTRLQLDLERATSKARFDIFTPPHLERSSFKKLAVLRGVIFGAAGFLLGAVIAIIKEIRRYVG